MHYNPDVFGYQYVIVNEFVQHVAYHRALNERYNSLQLESEFWCATISAHLLVAAINWCKVFGQDGCNVTHWKQVGHRDEEAMQKSFREKVYAETGFNGPQWTQFHEQMCGFRNKFVAHSEIGFSNPVPQFDKALQVAYAYDNWIRDAIAPHILDAERLKNHFVVWKTEAVRKASRGMARLKKELTK